MVCERLITRCLISFFRERKRNTDTKQSCLCLKVLNLFFVYIMFYLDDPCGTCGDPLVIHDKTFTTLDFFWSFLRLETQTFFKVNVSQEIHLFFEMGVWQLRTCTNLPQQKKVSLLAICYEEVFKIFSGLRNEVFQPSSQGLRLYIAWQWRVYIAWQWRGELQSH